jgi:hypothetical protein
MMQNFVTHILAPYFAAAKGKAGHPASQKMFWQIDVWSVHHSLEFWTWMKENHPIIILSFVPGGCTSIFQPCDVSIQRPFKLSIKKSYHEDIINKILDQKDESAVVLSKELAVSRSECLMVMECL